MITDAKLRQVKNAWSGDYTKARLMIILDRFVRPFLEQYRTAVIAEGVEEESLRMLNKKGLSKYNVVFLVSIPFCSEKLFRLFRETLPVGIRDIMKALLWRDYLSSDAIKDNMGITVYDTLSKVVNSRYSYNQYVLKKDFEIFLNKGDEYQHTYRQHPLFNLRLGPELRDILRNYYPRPVHADLIFLEKIEQTDSVFTGEKEILTIYPRLKAYYEQGRIKTTQNGKVNITTLGKLIKKVGSEEFYPEAEVKYMKSVRANLLASLISAKKREIFSSEPHEQIKYLFTTVLMDDFLAPACVLSYFKGMSYLYSGDNKAEMDNFIATFRKMVPGKWISAKNFTDYLNYNELSELPVNSYFAQDRLYFEEEKDGNGRGIKYKNYIRSGDQTDYVLLPFQKGICFLFAAYGLLDIAYDKIDFSKPGKSSKSPYEGLKYIRLTDLGAYVLGLKDTYDLPESITRSVTVLSEDSLTITAAAEDTTASIVLEPFAVRVSPNRYRTDFSFFLKGVENKKELESKISLFKSAVKTDLPPNWLEFFDELRGKINPLSKVGAVKVFKIPEENKDLLKLIAQDPLLQKYCLKAENYHIIIPNRLMTSFKSRLREFGYLL